MLAHVHVMKTGGQTICDILRQSFPGEHCDVQAGEIATSKDLQIASQFYPHMTSISGHCVRPLSDLQQACETIRFFTYLRDPVTRCASHYQFARQKNAVQLDFPSWLSQHDDYQTRYFTGIIGSSDRQKRDADEAIEVLEEHIGFVGLLERFNESLVLLRGWAEHAALDIRYRARNTAKDNRIKNELLNNPETVALIRGHHQEDEKLYRYAAEVVFPRQVEQFGATLDADVSALEASLPAPQRAIFARAVASVKRNVFYKKAAIRARAA